jgi:hypothetical protein
VKARAALPRLQVDLLSAANHNFLHALMLNRRCFLGRCCGEERL